jgi:hypothetical protein
VEPDVLYYRRRIADELGAAKRAVTSPARLRHLQLVEAFLARLEEAGEPLPIPKAELRGLKASSGSVEGELSGSRRC